ncbi:MAG: hypothetical protein H6559_37975 [Lewinellaceae bacterium]|nr:hypothetical protein [Lewinellaceae bacterium]
MLAEDPQLMELPVFVDSIYVTRKEAAFDWMMDLPYATLNRAESIFEALFDLALQGEKLQGNADSIMQKIKAITAKNHRGLPYAYLIKKLKAGNMPPAVQLELAQLAILHEEYSLNFSGAEALFNIQEEPYMLPALMEAYLKAGIDGACRALRVLNDFGEEDFPVRSVDLQNSMAYMLRETAIAFNKEFPADAKERLQSFIDTELEIRNTWLRGIVVEELGVDLKPFIENGKPEVQADESKEEALPEAEMVSLQESPTEEQVKSWARLLQSSKKFRAEFYEAVAQQFRKHKQRAAKNAKPLFTYLKRETNIELEKEFGLMRIAILIEPYYEVSEPLMGTYSERKLRKGKRTGWQSFVEEDLNELVASQTASLMN